MRSHSASLSAPLTLEAGFFWAWTLLLLWMPIPLGSNRVWAWAILEAGVFVLTAAWLLALFLRRVTIPVTLPRAKWFVLLLFFWLIYQAVYIVPIPLAWIQVISPEAAAMHVLADVLNSDVMNSSPTGQWKTLSVDPNAAMVSWLKSLCYGLTFVMTCAVVTTRQRAQTLAYTLVFSAVTMAVFGILMHLVGINIEWFGTLITHGAEASGTFPNRNHFAGYLEMMLALGIGLLIAGLRDHRAQSWKQFFRRFLEWMLGAKMRLRLMLCIMVIALVATHSRMGNAAFFSSLLIAGVIGIALARHATRGTVILLVSLLVIDVFIVGSWFGIEKLARRIEQTTIVKQVIAPNAATGAAQQSESVEERLDPSVYALQIIKDYPAVGSGPGSFYTTFPRYRGGDVAALFEYAHNDYIQFATESGVAGLAMLGLIVVWSLAVALRAQYTRRDPLMRGLSFASIMGIIALMIHSTVDFNLQIPANAMLFMVMLAFAWISLHLNRRSRA